MEVFHNNVDKIHIDNEHLDNLSDELTDVGNKYDDLKGSHWETAYQKAWDAALTNKEAGALGRRAESFAKSKEGQALHKELMELDDTLKKHVKVSDIPDSWK